MGDENRDEWRDYEKLVISKLESYDRKFDNLNDLLLAMHGNISDMRIAVTTSIKEHEDTCRVAKESILEAP